MTCFEFKWNRGICLSKEWRNAIPFATSCANWRAVVVSMTTAWDWVFPTCSCNTWNRDPIGIYWEMTTRFGGELQHPITGMTLGWLNILLSEWNRIHDVYLKLWKLGKIQWSPIPNSVLSYLNLGYSSLKSLEILGVHSLILSILAAISFPCHLPRHVSPGNSISSK